MKSPIQQLLTKRHIILEEMSEGLCLYGIEFKKTLKYAFLDSELKFIECKIELIRLFVKIFVK